MERNLVWMFSVMWTDTVSDFGKEVYAYSEDHFYKCGINKSIEFSYLASRSEPNPTVQAIMQGQGSRSCSSVRPDLKIKGPS
ncbi:hypothetical protein FPOAC1_001939 [Fusarium poae]|uniref:hypothetical protein n=1 Tax=Fusarium poae TaxID=36050 RepID=UPI001CE7526D|nr:hypothetical protein FPOAC1_001939 [Fusarium poae]KAG8675944.1 hypothetical protein FPOAC1_001939 [Fusarium poae]